MFNDCEKNINNEKRKLQDLVNLSSKFVKLVKYLEVAMLYNTSNNVLQKHFW